ncbi:NUDIX hydrolase [Microbacter margulisiae]|uniref:8-oxo-dGTP pyrophosphatase MutT (NUDIX family) n=1 Tax=Microbacter margulisiae TaxID=1350067 RepID=A0A7W5DSD1_9PORP|nr:CoA pyrophosphatase [Microbacter margulisiae]MBB3188187.1 8-oxo-dGTP pyrophosphatase MutT (NUDIX family) [Microbacter margulisiae]
MKTEDFNKLKTQFGYDQGLQSRDDYFNSVILVLLIPINGEYHFVFQKRSAEIRQGGEICFPGGKIDETDDTLESVALRETQEEMGIPADKIEVIGKLNTLVAPMGVIVDAFIGIADITLNELSINKSEVERVIAVPVSYFINNLPEQYSVQVQVHPFLHNEHTGEQTVLLPVVQLGLPETYTKPWGNFRYKVLVYKTDQGVIWGITARMVHEFVQKIEKLQKDAVA